MMEMKIAMILALQNFDLEVMYEEIDRRSPSKPNTVDGERAYQLTLSGPSEGLPCRVKPATSGG